MFTFYTRLPVIGEVYGELATNGSWQDRWCVWGGSEFEIRIGRILIQNSRSRRDRKYARALMIASCIGVVIWVFTTLLGGAHYHETVSGNLPLYQGAANASTG